MADSSPAPPAPAASVDLDLAFAADGAFAPELVQAAGAWADPLAGAECWHGLVERWLGQLAGELPAALRAPAYSLGLSLVGDAEIAALNADWRGKPGPTDVLAFAALDDDCDGAPPLPLPPGLTANPDADADDADADEEEVAEDDADWAGDADDDDEVEDGDEVEDEDWDDDEGAEDDVTDDDEAEDDEHEDDEAEGDQEDADDASGDSGGPWASAGAEPLELGDIVISLDTAARQAAEHGHSLERELQFLASHGLLHLLGWDHPDEASLQAMLERQELLICATLAERGERS